MTRKVLTYLLVTMIAMQSFVAMADVHQPHQSEGKHLAFEHTHNDPEERVGLSSELVTVELGLVKNLSSALFDASSLDAFSPDDFSLEDNDCHHCCHCHSVSYLKAASNGDVVFPYKSHLILSSSVDYLFYTPSPDLRPPIV